MFTPPRTSFYRRNAPLPVIRAFSASAISNAPLIKSEYFLLRSRPRPCPQRSEKSVSSIWLTSPSHARRICIGLFLLRRLFIQYMQMVDWNSLRNCCFQVAGALSKPFSILVLRCITSRHVTSPSLETIAENVVGTWYNREKITAPLLKPFGLMDVNLHQFRKKVLGFRVLN